MNYQIGFLNHFASEAVAGALPKGRNSPQRPAFGLYTEQFSTTAFTAPRGESRRSWFYRLRPSAAHGKFERVERGEKLASGPFDPRHSSPNRLRWDPLTLPDPPTDWLDGLTTYAGNGDPGVGTGVAIHLYAANKSMIDRVFQNSDGELLIVPQQGTLCLTTEMGKLDVPPGMIAVIPRGLRFSVGLDGPSRGFVCENYGQAFRLPDLGPIGSNGLANPRDFESPVAWFEDIERPHELVQKYHGGLWRLELDRSPFDVVAWHGNSAPCRYDLSRFNVIGSTSFDHPDPSIFTVLTSPTDQAGTANCDFVIFPPRWMVAEDTFRPPWFHRNVMSEFMGLIRGVYDAKEGGGFEPGGASLHNQMNSHGPDWSSTKRAMEADLKPHKIDGTMAFMFESRSAFVLTPFAAETDLLQGDYDACWDGFPKAQLP